MVEGVPPWGVPPVLVTVPPELLPGTPPVALVPPEEEPPTPGSLPLGPVSPEQAAGRRANPAKSVKTGAARSLVRLLMGSPSPLRIAGDNAGQSGGVLRRAALRLEVRFIHIPR